MDRLFLDANVLFSAAYRDNSGLLRLWGLSDVELVTSAYAAEEARLNLSDDIQRGRLKKLLTEVRELAETTVAKIPADIPLPEKDWPILAAAMSAKATHLLTGDKMHFGKYFGRRIEKILVLPPGEFLRRRA